MKKIIYLVAAFLCMACSDDHGSNQENGGASGHRSDSGNIGLKCGPVYG